MYQKYPRCNGDNAKITPTYKPTKYAICPECEVCDGTGKVTMEKAEEYVQEFDYEIEIRPYNK